MAAAITIGILCKILVPSRLLNEYAFQTVLNSTPGRWFLMLSKVRLFVSWRVDEKVEARGALKLK